MKLENKNDNYKEMLIGLFLVIILTFGISFIVNVINFSNLLEVLVISLFIIIMVLVTIFLVYILVKDKNINKKKLKSIGQKIQGNIVEVGHDNIYYYRGGPVMDKLCYIIVSYDGKSIQVNNMKENFAYSILNLLLNPYPVKKNVQIPIDVYVYKNKAYVDLDSVDLIKVEGYEDAKKAVQDAWQID